uniref:Nucleotide exchange factor SIL1 n=1 Tax=Junco hyemalis TaxID=40217 RepID=A0A8C5IJ23_JUNHY
MGKKHCWVCFALHFRLVAMSPWAGLLSSTSRVSLLLLLGSVLLSCSSLGQREFALTKIEERDIKDDSGKELGTEDDADPEDLEHASGTHLPALTGALQALQELFVPMTMCAFADYEIMVKLISKFNSSASTLDEKVAALYDLEYYVHQVDNAKDFLSMGGLRLVIEGLNSSEASLKEHAAFVLGAALSSNPKVQIEAIEGGALQKLLVILATEQPLAVRKKALFALSSMLRHFPYAQQQFLKLGGLQVLRSLFRQKGMEPLHVRVVTLLYDLIMEKVRAGHGEQMEEKIQQYQQVRLVPAVVEQGWCALVPNLLAMPEHDTREKVLKLVGVLVAFCREHYRGDPALGTTLSLLRSEYEELAAQEQREGDKDGYFRELLGSINTIIQELR